jgi:hypothetical protein
VARRFFRWNFGYRTGSAAVAMLADTGRSIGGLTSTDFEKRESDESQHHLNYTRAQMPVSFHCSFRKTHSAAWLC